MQLMKYGGQLLVRNGSLATSAACCCVACPIGTLDLFAFYFNDLGGPEVGQETTFTDDVKTEFLGKYFGFDLSALFWIANDPFLDVASGKYYWDTFQIFALANCCVSCDDFYYRDKQEAFATNWARIVDPASQYEHDPNWQVGGCAGDTIENDEGIDVLFQCAKDAIELPYEVPDGAFVFRKSIEVCCD